MSFYLILINLILIKSDELYIPVNLNFPNNFIISFPNDTFNRNIQIGLGQMDVPVTSNSINESVLEYFSVILRSIYNIPDNEQFIILRGFSIDDPSRTILTVYAKINGTSTQLNLDICNNNKIVEPITIKNDEIFKIINNFEGGFDYNYSYLDEGYEDMQRIENGYVTFTTVDTQKKYNGNNNTVVDFSECEELIKRDNGLEDNDNI